MTGFGEEGESRKCTKKRHDFTLKFCFQSGVIWLMMATHYGFSIADPGSSFYHTAVTKNKLAGVENGPLLGPWWLAVWSDAQLFFEHSTKTSQGNSTSSCFSSYSNEPDSRLKKCALSQEDWKCTSIQSKRSAERFKEGKFQKNYMGRSKEKVIMSN